jgi:hypothetical protein
MARATLDPTSAGAAGGWVHVRLSRRKGWHNIADAEWLAAPGAARLLLKALVALASHHAKGPTAKGTIQNLRKLNYLCEQPEMRECK